MSGSIIDPTPLPFADPSCANLGMEAKLFCVLSKVVEDLGLEWSTPEEPTHSHLDPGRPLVSEPPRFSRKSTTSS